MKKKYLIGAVIIFVLTGICFIYANNKEPYTDNGKIRHYTAFFAVEGKERSKSNPMCKAIAEITGADCDEIWLRGQNKDDAVKYYIANGEYPDFISGNRELYEEKVIIPLDEYLDNYPNLRKYVDKIGEDILKMDDGHIYWIPPYGVVNGRDSEVIHQGEAFWIQVKVLKWAGYPEITTLDEYFDLLERYVEANPFDDNGEPNIPYTILCDDWKYFCLENPPQFLDGYPNDGCCMVDPVTKKVMDYNTTPTAKRYFKKLNEEYHNGIIDVESFTGSYNEYLTKLSTGRVLGMVDQWWNFAYDTELPSGCSYVPLPITIDKGIRNKWHVERSNEMDISDGVAVTVSCDDVEGALQFMNDLLSEEVQKLRFWGVEGIDYQIDENGRYYRTKEQRAKGSNSQQGEYFCIYSYFPRFEGTYESDGNAYSPEYQPEEFFDSLSTDMRECFEAYGCKTYVDMLGTNRQPGNWYPMYSYSTLLTYATESGMVWKRMEETKHIWLPQVVLSDDFETTWNEYISAYNECRPEIFFEDLQQELDRRVDMERAE